MIDVALDDRHAAAIEAACAGDRARAAAGDRQFIRIAVDHEFCVPSEPCIDWPTLVVVTELAPGLRSRRPLAAAEGAA